MHTWSLHPLLPEEKHYPPLVCQLLSHRSVLSDAAECLVIISWLESATPHSYNIKLMEATWECHCTSHPHYLVKTLFLAPSVFIFTASSCVVANSQQDLLPVSIYMSHRDALFHSFYLMSVFPNG